MYIKGEGLQKDEIEGLAWLYLAEGNNPAIGFQNTLPEEIASVERKLGVDKARTARRRSAELKLIINSEIYARTGMPVPEPLVDLIGSGTGVVISRNGIVLASARIVAGAESIKIKTIANTYPAEILEIDRDNDLVILKYDGTGTPLPVTSSGHIRVDQRVFPVLSTRPLEKSGIGAGLASETVSRLTGAKKNPGYLQIGGGFATPDPRMPQDVRRKIQDMSGRLFNDTSGPVLDASGNLIGMISYKDMRKDGFVYVLRSEALRSLLKKYGVEITAPSENKNSVSQNPVIGRVPVVGRVQPPMHEASASSVMILVY
jgi:hypothetical protein